VWQLSAAQSAEYQETAKKGQSIVILLMFAETDISFDTCTLIIC
jgi:hypothetical protein